MNKVNELLVLENLLHFLLDFSSLNCFAKVAF